VRNHLENLVIDAEFAKLLIPLAPDERALLEESLLKHGCREPLIAWRHNGKLILLDGHNRKKLCELHGIHYEVATIELESREAAKLWIRKNQLGRRNLPDDARAMLAARLLPEMTKASLSERGRAAGTAKSAVDAVRLIKREDMRDAPPLVGRYRIFYVDPPWDYGNSGLQQYGHASFHYPPMSTDELCDLDIKARAIDDAVLFLWVTSPLLAECFRVVDAWHFAYKTSFIWNKVKHNFGHYNSVRHELLLVCTRGSCTPDNPKLYNSVQAIERSPKHSAKPEEFRKIIDSMYRSPKGRNDRIELFPRERPPKHWDSWGNEVPQDEP
jgi:N6-adenosine-specific RNA methylase IME4